MGETTQSLEHRALDHVAEHRELLLRIALSKTFHRCSRLHDLLLDIGERTLAGETAQLSEQSIGIRVFGRSEGYNSSDDNIVRASVRQVRLKLKEYFETEGRDEPWIFEIPKGGYVAVFKRRDLPVLPPADLPETVRRAARTWLVPALGGLCACLMALCAFLVIRESKAAAHFRTADAHHGVISPESRSGTVRSHGLVTGGDELDVRFAAYR